MVRKRSRVQSSSTALDRGSTFFKVLFLLPAIAADLLPITGTVRFPNARSRPSGTTFRRIPSPDPKRTVTRLQRQDKTGVRPRNTRPHRYGKRFGSTFSSQDNSGRHGKGAFCLNRKRRKRYRMRFRNVRRYAVGGHRASVQKAVFPFGKIPGMRFRDRIPPAAFRADRSAETDRKTEIFRRPGSETRHESGRGLSSGDRTNEFRRTKNNLSLPVFGNIFHIFVFDASVRHGIDDPMRRRVRFGACRQQKFACETVLPNGPG